MGGIGDDEGIGDKGGMGGIGDDEGIGGKEGIGGIQYWPHSEILEF